MKQTLVILNPTAGNADQRHSLLQGITEWRTQLGWTVDIHETHGPGDATVVARQRAADYDLVVAAGGDGTINEVVNGLAHTATPLGAIPLGTGNVWVRELHQSLDPLKAARQLVQGQIKHVDLGVAHTRYFLLMAGIGIDAAVTSAVNSAEKHRFGRLAYVVRGLPLFWRMRGTRTQIMLDGQPLIGNILFVLISNSRRYGGVLNIAYRAAITDGLLDVCVFEGRNVWAAPHLLAGTVLRGHGVVPGLHYYQAREIEINCSYALPVQIDGDTIGTTPMKFSISPRSLYVLVPPTIEPSDLLTAPPQPWWQRL